MSVLYDTDSLNDVGNKGTKYFSNICNSVDLITFL